MKFIPAFTAKRDTPCFLCQRPGAPDECCYGALGLLHRTRQCNDALAEAGVPAEQALRYYWAKAPEHSTLEDGP